VLNGFKVLPLKEIYKVKLKSKREKAMPSSINSPEPSVRASTKLSPRSLPNGVLLSLTLIPVSLTKLERIFKATRSWALELVERR
jgi:hypothetical protein